MTVRPQLTPAQREEFERRCARAALHPGPLPPQPGGIVDLMRLAIMVEVATGKHFTFDPVMAAAGEPGKPVPQWLIISRGGNI